MVDFVSSDSVELKEKFAATLAGGRELDTSSPFTPIWEHRLVQADVRYISAKTKGDRRPVRNSDQLAKRSAFRANEALV